MVEWTWSGWACPQTEHPFAYYLLIRSLGAPILRSSSCHTLILGFHMVWTPRLSWQTSWNPVVRTPAYPWIYNRRHWREGEGESVKGNIAIDLKGLQDSGRKMLTSQRPPRKIIHFERRGFCGNKLYFPVLPLFHRRKHSKLISWPLIPKFVPSNNSGSNDNSDTTNL